MSDYFNINEAAKVTGKSIPTIRAKLSQGLLPDAHQVTEGRQKRWRIPLADLISSGLLDGNAPAGLGGVMQESRVVALEIEIDRLSAELKRERERTEEIRQLAEERKQTIEDYRERERRLYYTLETKETQERRRSLWQRIKGDAPEGTTPRGS
jgi:hypothetical protein